jgi:hypothetical protein
MNTPPPEFNPIGSPRQFVLACIGLVSVIFDELPALMEKSVQRGSVMLKQTPPPARRSAASHSPIQLGLPTRADFNTLLQQVNALEQEVDRILAERAASK